MMHLSLRQTLTSLSTLALLIAVGCAVEVQETYVAPSDSANAGQTSDPAQRGPDALPSIDPIIGPIPLRDTADRGNASGVHGCVGEVGEYAHYEDAQAIEAAEARPQLHVVSVYAADDNITSARPFDRGDVEVHITRSGSSTLVLSSYAPTNWIITTEPGASIERIILSGHSRQTASAPAGTPVDEYSYETNNSSLGSGVEWPSYDTADLVMTAELVTGLPLTSYRGCFASAGFQIDQPTEIAAPRATTPRAEPSAIAGCEDVTAESTYCTTIAGGRLTMIGLDSGATCAGPDVATMSYDNPSLAWVGDHVYTCLYDRGIARISTIDGSVDVAPVACGAVTNHRGSLAATAMVGNNPAGPPLSQLVHFDSFESAACRDSDRAYGKIAKAGVMATRGDLLYTASRTSAEVEIGNIAAPGSGSIDRIELEGFHSWLTAMAVTGDGKLIAAGPTSGGLRVHDADTGAFERMVTLDDEAIAAGALWGLDCVTNAAE